MTMGMYKSYEGFCNLMSDSNRPLHCPRPFLNDLSPLFPEIPCERNRIPAFEHGRNLFQGETRNLWIEQDDQNPSNKADSTIESESTTWRQAFHHGEECRADNDV